MQRSRPYPFELDLRTGPTHVTAHGQFTRPFDLGQIQAVGTATGADLADLYDLTGVVLPTRPITGCRPMSAATATPSPSPA